MDPSRNYVKISIKLEVDEDGFPPVDWEDVWAIDLKDGRYEIANVPFYARGVSYGDIVSVVSQGDRLTFDSLLKAGEHSTVHVVMYDEKLVQTVRDQLKDLFCSTELSNISTYFSVDIPAGVDYRGVSELLEKHAAEGKLDYQESTLRHSE